MSTPEDNLLSLLRGLTLVFRAPTSSERIAEMEKSALFRSALGLSLLWLLLWLLVSESDILSALQNETSI